VTRDAVAVLICNGVTQRGRVAERAPERLEERLHRLIGLRRSQAHQRRQDGGVSPQEVGLGVRLDLATSGGISKAGRGEGQLSDRPDPSIEQLLLPEVSSQARGPLSRWAA